MTLTPNQSNASVQALPLAIGGTSMIAARLPRLPADPYNRGEGFSWALSAFNSSHLQSATLAQH